MVKHAYAIAECDQKWFTDEMFEGLAEDENMREYNVGDKVLIRADRGKDWNINGLMDKYCDTVMTIESIDACGLYTMVEAPRWLFSKDDFVKKVEIENMFTKKDLKDGMVIEYRNGDLRLVLNGYVMSNDLCLELKKYDDNLIYSNGSTYDIMKVYKTSGFDFNTIFYRSKLTLIWERKEVKEMTVEEIEKELGYKVKVIAND